MGIETPPPPVNGNFVNEGTFLAMPPSFPGVSLPPPADETRIHRLFLSSSKTVVFAATRGPTPHLIQYAPKSTYGYAVDLEAPAGFEEITAVICRPGEFSGEMMLAGSSGAGASIFTQRAAHIEHGIQEWLVRRRDPVKALDLPVDRIIGMVRAGSSSDEVFAWGPGKGFFLEWTNSTVTLQRSIDLPLPLFSDPLDENHLIGSDLRLHGIDWEKREVNAGQLITGKPLAPVILAPFAGGVVWAEADGSVFEWNQQQVRSRGRIPLLPVHALCRLRDGRIYASAGPDIAHWYVIEEGEEGCEWARDLGVPVSTLTTRRYGLQFSHLVVGRDGEIFAGEDDRGGHLWIYFPPLGGG